MTLPLPFDAPPELEVATRRILTVSELTARVKECLETAFPDVWVRGEASNVRSPASGHLYLTLKDEKAQLRAVLFRSAGRGLKFVPQDGQELLCRGRLALYEPKGEYELIIEYLEPVGIGALQLAFEQLKERLRREGLFAPERKKPLPLLPRRIGIVTSPSGAAIRDILKILRRRFVNLQILIHPVAVQGAEAAGEIAEAIDELNRRGGLDVLIVGRGGGSLEDLWAFNEEIVARAIARSEIPVISAVGHETDYTIADFVADLRAPTPSAAAELVVRTKTELEEGVRQLAGRMNLAVRAALERMRNRVRSEQRALGDPQRRLEGLMQRVDDLTARLQGESRRAIRQRQSHAAALYRTLLSRSPLDRVRALQGECFHLGRRMQQQIAFGLRLRRERMGRAASALDNLSPLAILGRGYSIVKEHVARGEGRVIKDARTVSKGQRLDIRLARGELVCGVEQVSVDENPP